MYHHRHGAFWRSHQRGVCRRIPRGSPGHTPCLDSWRGAQRLLRECNPTGSAASIQGHGRYRVRVLGHTREGTDVGQTRGGTNNDEERLFMFLRQFGLPVSDGTNVPAPGAATPESYRRVIAFVSGVTDKRAAAIAAEYPVFTYPSPIDAFSELVRDAPNSRARRCRWTHGPLGECRPSRMSSTTFHCSFSAGGDRLVSSDDRAVRSANRSHHILGMR